MSHILSRAFATFYVFLHGTLLATLSCNEGQRNSEKVNEMEKKNDKISAITSNAK